jgi:hypothetical protein
MVLKIDTDSWDCFSPHYNVPIKDSKEHQGLSMDKERKKERKKE